MGIQDIEILTLIHSEDGQVIRLSVFRIDKFHLKHSQVITSINVKAFSVLQDMHWA